VKNRRVAVRSRFSEVQDVDDLAELVDGPVQVHPPAADFDVVLVDQPAIPWGVPARPLRVD
jgi:hypothetical protein